MRVAIGVACVLAACDADTLRIALEISGGPVQACPSAAVPPAPGCGDVPMACDAVLDIRVVRPSSPQETYLPLCQPIPQGRERDLCSIEQINLPARQLPNETLEVQVMIWPRDAVREDPATGELDCRMIHGQPVSIGFGVHGFPEETVPSPALGGRAYYHPGDDLTVVTLGCADLPAVNRPACAGQIEVAAGVVELGRWLTPISPPAPVVVSIGEPRYDAARAVHEWWPIAALAPLPGGPGWSGALDTLDVDESLCVEVLGNLGPNTAAVVCDRIDASARIFELTGVWLPTERLESILAGLGLAEVPPQGLTIGVLLDEQGNPAIGYQIRTSPGTTLKYLSLTGQVVPGAQATTQAGLFVSQDAAYGTDFGAYQGDLVPRASGIGGRVQGKVTITVLRLGSASGG